MNKDFWESLTSAQVADNIFRMLILLLLWVVARTVIVAVSNTIVKALSSETPRGKRLRTLSKIFSRTATGIVTVIFLFMVLKEVGFDITPLLASAGVVGIAIGFGAQTLVKDTFSGLFLLLDGDFDEGDLVEISGKKGTVEKINLRSIEIRDTKGALHIIPAGSITMVSNFSKN